MKNLKILVGLIFLATLLIASGETDSFLKIYKAKEEAILKEFRKQNSGGVLTKKAEKLVDSTGNSELIKVYKKLSGKNKEVIDAFIAKIEFKEFDGEYGKGKLYRNEKHKNYIQTKSVAKMIIGYIASQEVLALYSDIMNGHHTIHEKY